MGKGASGQNIARVGPKKGDRAVLKRPKKHADFSDLVGKWTPDPAYDEIIAFQRRIDAEKWN
jgi:hypothetical protein